MLRRALLLALALALLVPATAQRRDVPVDRTARIVLSRRAGRDRPDRRLRRRRHDPLHPLRRTRQARRTPAAVRVSADSNSVDCPKVGRHEVVLDLGDGDDVAAVSAEHQPPRDVQRRRRRRRPVRRRRDRHASTAARATTTSSPATVAPRTSTAASATTPRSPTTPTPGCPASRSRATPTATASAAPPTATTRRRRSARALADVPDNGIDEDCSGADTTAADRDGDGTPRPQDCNDADDGDPARAAGGDRQRHRRELRRAHRPVPADHGLGAQRLGGGGLRHAQHAADGAALPAQHGDRDDAARDGAARSTSCAGASARAAAPSACDGTSGVARCGAARRSRSGSRSRGASGACCATRSAGRATRPTSSSCAWCPEGARPAADGLERPLLRGLHGRRRLRAPARAHGAAGRQLVVHAADAEHGAAPLRRPLREPDRVGQAARRLDVHARARHRPERHRRLPARHGEPRLGRGAPPEPGLRGRHDLLGVRGARGARVALAAERRHRHRGHARLQPGRRRGDHVQAHAAGLQARSRAVSLTAAAGSTR